MLVQPTSQTRRLTTSLTLTRHERLTGRDPVQIEIQTGPGTGLSRQPLNTVLMNVRQFSLPPDSNEVILLERYCLCES